LPFRPSNPEPAPQIENGAFEPNPIFGHFFPKPLPLIDMPTPQPAFFPRARAATQILASIRRDYGILTSPASCCIIELRLHPESRAGRRVMSERRLFSAHLPLIPYAQEDNE
jgi:hypothetical protein